MSSDFRRGKKKRIFDSTLHLSSWDHSMINYKNIRFAVPTEKFAACSSEIDDFSKWKPRIFVYSCIFISGLACTCPLFKWESTVQFKPYWKRTAMLARRLLKPIWIYNGENRIALHINLDILLYDNAGYLMYSVAVCVLVNCQYKPFAEAIIKNYSLPLFMIDW